MAAVRKWLRRRRPELRLSARVTVAGLVSFVLASLLGLPQGYWAVFTAILVTQASVGGSLNATFDRLIGTLSGALYGALIATFVPHANLFAAVGALALSLAPLAVLAAMNSTFRVAPVTAIILLLGNTGAQEGPVLAGLLRIVEVGLGGVVGLAVSVVVLPARAHAVMGDAANKVLGLQAELLAMLIQRLARATERDSVQAQHDRIQSAFDRLETAAEEAHRERRTLIAEEIDPEPLPRTLRRIYHDLVLVGRVSAQPLPEKESVTLFPSLSGLSVSAGEFLRGAGAALARRRLPPSIERATHAIGECLAALKQAEPNGDNAARLAALAFALEQLQRNLRDLAARTEEFARGRNAKA
jgi:uncharacterized membrane protein YccC